MYANLEKGVTMYMYNASEEISGSTNLEHLENAALPFSLVLVVFIAVMILFSIRRILVPLNGVRNAISTISSGEADLTHRINADINSSPSFRK